MSCQYIPLYSLVLFHLHAIIIHHSLHSDNVIPYIFPPNYSFTSQHSSLYYHPTYPGKKTYAFVEHNRRAGTYDPETQRLPRHLDVRLIGYYQSWRYFTNIEADLRREFACSTNVSFRLPLCMRKYGGIRYCTI